MSARAKIQRTTRGVQWRRDRAIEALHATDWLTTRQVADVVGASAYTVWHDLVQLETEGHVRARVGPRGHTQWRLRVQG